MSTYIVGDVHGCFKTLELLLLEIPFETGRDHLWLTGDLVNRGPASLEVLRWAEAAERSLADRFVAVLGNHDLHLLASAAGYGRPHHRAILRSVLEAPDREPLIQWLARRPLFHRRGSVGLVHAGLLPGWSLDEAEARARGLEKTLRDVDRRQDLFKSMADAARAPLDLYAFTSMRLLDGGGEPSDFTGPPILAPAGCVPWFSIPDRESRSVTLYAGHWAALGLHMEPNFVALDTGCVYGGALTAIRLEDREIFSVPIAEADSSPTPGPRRPPTPPPE